MANLKEVRNRIASVASTMQITSAMKMVSAAKLRKAQNAVVSFRPYSATLTQVIDNVMGDNVDIDSPYNKERHIDNVLLVVLSSNKGLCGAFNSSVIKQALHRIKDYYKQDKYIKVDVWSFGRKSSDFFAKSKEGNLIKRSDELWENLSFDKLSEISSKLMDSFAHGTYDAIEIIYNHFKNVATQQVCQERFLPLTSLNNNDSKDTKEEKKFYIFEPSREQIMSNIIPQALNSQFYKCFLDSFASEHGARMTSMNKATDNATQLLKDLKLSYNKVRQAAITNEIIEISSASEALKG
jgi:ATP synthase, F1 gamma subunit